MRQDGKSTIRQRAILGFGAMVIPVVLIALVSTYSLYAFNHAIEEVVEESELEGRPMLSLLMGVQKADLKSHDFLNYGTETGRMEYEEIAEAMTRAFQNVVEAPFEDEREEELVRRAFFKWKVVNNLILSHTPKDDAAFNLQHMRKVDAQFHELEASLEEALRRASEEIKEEKESVMLVWPVARALIAGLVVLSAAGSFLLMSWLARGIGRPLEDLARRVKSVGTGALPEEVGWYSADELGRLARAVNDMAERVHEDTSALKDRAEHDELTGLFNHGAIIDLLEEEVQRSIRYGRPFSFLLLDVDHFKDINDTYGHVAGDTAVRQLGSIVRESVRIVDKAGRYGGDEIAVIMPEAEGEAAIALAERLRLCVSSQQLALPEGEIIRIKVSIGLAEFPGGKDTAKDLVAAADEALYSAKREGRDRVCLEPWLKDREG
jgi:diguanylate cyclase (GGDEF)-like protein